MAWGAKVGARWGYRPRRDHVKICGMMGLDGAGALVGGGGGGTAALGLPSLIGGAINGTRGAWIAVIGLAEPSSLLSSSAVTPCTEKGLGQALFTKLKMMSRKTCVRDGRW